MIPVSIEIFGTIGSFDRLREVIFMEGKWRDKTDIYRQEWKVEEEKCETLRVNRALIAMCLEFIVNYMKR